MSIDIDKERKVFEAWRKGSIEQERVWLSSFEIWLAAKRHAAEVAAPSGASVEGELLPCPFCGGDAQTDFIEGESYLIECYVCSANAGAQDGEEEAIAAWNRRASVEGATPTLYCYPECSPTFHALDARDADRYRWLRKNVVSLTRTPVDVDAELREQEWHEWEESADIHIKCDAAMSPNKEG